MTTEDTFEAGVAQSGTAEITEQRKRFVAERAFRLPTDTRIEPMYDKDDSRITFYFVNADSSHVRNQMHIDFQAGVIPETGVNGVTNEAVIQGLILRITDLNQPPFNCRENSLAITHLEEALHWLEARTQRRIREGKEGTYVP